MTWKTLAFALTKIAFETAVNVLSPGDYSSSEYLKNHHRKSSITGIKLFIKLVKQLPNQDIKLLQVNRLLFHARLFPHSV